MNKNACIKLAEFAKGNPTLENFRYEEIDLPNPANGEALIRIDWISIDPGLVTRTKSRENYQACDGVNEVMFAMAVGEVIESNRSDRKVGDYVLGDFGMQSFALDGPQNQSRIIDPKIESIRLSLSLLGLVGLTAYFGLLDIGQPKTGETVLISAGAGAVGSIAAKIAKIKGCHTVGIVGSEEKIHHCISQLGYDAAISRKVADFSLAIKNACPNGVDIFFDNTGGPIYDEALKVMNIGGRIIGSGRIASAHFADPSKDIGPRDTDVFIVKRLMKKGLLVGDYATRFAEGLSQLSQWHKEGKIQITEDILEGIERAPEGLMRVISGQNTGKQLIRVAH